ncbi:DUF433 domain-containing protein [Candidatus Poribacteria bacterium]|nr:DUF433 domain-containing protein [Candidatus Poribacteria bacterium]
MAQKQNRLKLVGEVQGDDVYEYYPLGEYVVVAPGVCGGRPTFKGTRVEVEVILDWLRVGRNLDDILESYPSLTRPAIEEAIKVAARTLVEHYASLAVLL